MSMRSRPRFVSGRRLLSGVAIVAGSAACVDLFHSTDFDTLCTIDPSKCAPEAGDVEAGPGGEAGPDAPSRVDTCKFSHAEAKAVAERACAWMGACAGSIEESKFGTCMIRALAAYDCAINPALRPQGEADDLWQCLLDVRSCKTVSDCLFHGKAPACPPIDKGSFTACTSDGKSRARCASADAATNPADGVEVCVLDGRGCSTLGADKAACTGGLHDTCSGPPQCAETHAVQCDGTLDVGLDCALFGGGRCVADDAGAVACAPSEGSAACDAGLAIACDDDAGIARRCVEGHLETIDCRQMGLECQSSISNGTQLLNACVKVSSPCVADDTCPTATTLKSCSGGGTFELDCAALGLGACKLVTTNTIPVARCTAPQN